MLTGANANHRYLDMNGVPYRPQAPVPDALPSAFLLDTAFEQGVLRARWREMFGQVKTALGAGNIVWGIKNQSGRLFLECYFYYPAACPSHKLANIAGLVAPYMSAPMVTLPTLDDYQCLSIDLAADHIPGINIYTLDSHEHDQIAASSWFLSPGSSQLTSMNRYFSDLRERGFHDDGFHFADSSRRVETAFRAVFPGADSGLTTHWRTLASESGIAEQRAPVGVAHKRGAVGIYFMGLGIDELTGFLRHHDYPAIYVSHIEARRHRLSHMRYDVGIDLALSADGLDIVKTAFFGSS